MDHAADHRTGPGQRTGLLIILSSPSGAGKSTLARRLMEWDPHLRFSVSATTRPPRPGEVDGQHYHFTTADSFRSLVGAGQMLEHAEVFGNFYGTPRGPVEVAMREGRDTLFDVDWQGAADPRLGAGIAGGVDLRAAALACGAGAAAAYARAGQ